MPTSLTRFLAVILAVVATASSAARAQLPREEAPDLESLLKLPHAIVEGQGVEGLKLVSASHDRLFQIGTARWDVNQDTGQIIFTSPNGLQASAAVQFVGSYNTADGTWLWSWANSSIDARLTSHARRVQEYGRRRALAELTTRKLSITQDRARVLTALTYRVNGAGGAHVGRAGDLLVFFTFGVLKLTKAPTPAR